jgi:hypothetical protein
MGGEQLKKERIMQRTLRPYAIAGIAILGAGCFVAFAPITPRLPDVEVPAIDLTSDPGLLGDFDILFDDFGGTTDSPGGGLLPDLDLGNLLGGLDVNNVLGGVGAADLGDLLGALHRGSVGAGAAAPG